MRWKARLPRTIVISALFCAGCGSDLPGSTALSCTSMELLGNWYQASNNETLGFQSSCLYTSTVCGIRGNLTSLDTTAKSFGITGISTAFPGTAGCETTDRNCTYTLSGTTLTVTCSGNGGGTFSKI